jgi:hypothetical protein
VQLGRTHVRTVSRLNAPDTRLRVQAAIRFRSVLSAPGPRPSTQRTCTPLSPSPGAEFTCSSAMLLRVIGKRRNCALTSASLISSCCGLKRPDSFLLAKSGRWERQRRRCGDERLDHRGDRRNRYAGIAGADRGVGQPALVSRRTSSAAVSWKGRSFSFWASALGRRHRR